MNKARALHNLGQRLWLDSISRAMLDDGRLAHYALEFGITDKCAFRCPTVGDQLERSIERYSYRSDCDLQ